MPITKELENLRKFESVGFSHEQAETLTDVIETAIVDSQQDLKESICKVVDDLRKEIRNEFKDLRTEMDTRFKVIDDKFKDVHTEITTSELRIKASHTDLLVKIFAIVACCTSVGVAVSKAWK